MVIKIQQPIVDYKVATDSEVESAEAEKPQNSKAENVSLIGSQQSYEDTQYHEDFKRPPHLYGKTYKIKSPLSHPHALYVTINDLVINPNTKVERRYPYEIFLNSKNMDHFQWMVALTRIISAVFRKGGDIAFIPDEMKAIFDPRGGYFKGSQFIPSLVAEIGDVLERHMKSIGIIKEQEKPEHVQKWLDEKQKQYNIREQGNSKVNDSSSLKDAMLCSKCYVKAVISQEGCLTCLNCGDSKCS